MRNKFSFFVLATILMISCKSSNVLQRQPVFDLPEVYCSDFNLFSDLSKFVLDTLTKGVFYGQGVVLEKGKYSYKPKTDKTTYNDLIYFKYKNAKNKEIILIDSVDVYQKFKHTNPYISQVVCFDKINTFVEVKSTSRFINNYKGYFYLTLYLDGKSIIEKPDSYIDIGNIIKYSTKIFRNSNAISPQYAINNSETWNGLKGYDGVNDKIILTTTFDETAYKNKIDEFDLELSEKTAASYVKTNCDKLCKQSNKNKNLDWIYFTKNEVCKENSLTNAQLGRHYDDILTFNAWKKWDEPSIPLVRPIINESFPDRSRNVQLSMEYNTEVLGEFEAFSLYLQYFADLTIGENHTIKVNNNFHIEEDTKLILKKNAKFEYQIKE